MASPSLQAATAPWGLVSSRRRPGAAATEGSIVHRRAGNFGLSVEGSTAAANAIGLGFEEAVGIFEDYLNNKYPGEYLFTKKTAHLPKHLKQCLSQFFCLASAELGDEPPDEPRIGDIYRDASSQTVLAFTKAGTWKTAREGIAPDRVLLCRKTDRLVLIEAKYGDTEGNAHIERAGARATPSFLHSVARVFDNKAACLYIFGGPMVTARDAEPLDPKVGQRGKNQGKIVQSPEDRRWASARYRRQIDVLFGDGHEPAPWSTVLWDDQGLAALIERFEYRLKFWLNQI